VGRFARQFEGVYREISRDILKFCRAMNFQPTRQQKELLVAIQRAQMGLESNWIACKSGQGPGKTKCSVYAALWRTIQAVDALTVLTAPTQRQCKDVWLSECRKSVEKADPVLQRFIKVTKSKVVIGGRPDWGIKTVTASKEENAQGYHDPNMTVICEEASGIPTEIVTQFKGTLSNPNSLFMMIGNPNSRQCAFFDCFHSQRHRWKTLTFNAEDTARDYPWIVSPQRNKDLEEEFGRDSDVYRIRVLGEFPHSDPNCVLSSEDLEKVVDRKRMVAMAKIPRANRQLARQFGLDFARYGGDENTIFRRSGNSIVDWRFFAHVDPSQTVDAAFRMQKEAHWKDEDCWYVADAGGMGQGVMHMFYEREKQVVEFNNGSRAMDPDYDNKITEAWFHFARLTRKQRCYLPGDNRLMQQLSGRRYYVTKKGKLVLETKDEYMKRGFDSPDRADGCVLSFYDEVEAVAHITAQQRAGYELGTKAR